MFFHSCSTSFPPQAAPGWRVGEIGVEAEPFPEQSVFAPSWLRESVTMVGLLWAHISGSFRDVLVLSVTPTRTFYLMPWPSDFCEPYPSSSAGCPPIVLGSVLSGGAQLTSEQSLSSPGSLHIQSSQPKLSQLFPSWQLQATSFGFSRWGVGSQERPVIQKQPWAGPWAVLCLGLGGISSPFFHILSWWWGRDAAGLPSPLTSGRGLPPTPQCIPSLFWNGLSQTSLATME